MDNFIAARSQMGMSLAFHIIFATIGVSLPLMMTISEWRWRSTGDPAYLLLAKRWAKGTTILFAVGAISGTVNSAAPSNILSGLEVAVAVGAVVLIPSLILLLLVFKTHRKSLSAIADTTLV
jgi:cytochrome bd-type quinol oxidase subunit 1